MLPFTLAVRDLHAAPVPQANEQDIAARDFFKQKILPILSARCRSCHNDTLKMSGLSFDSPEGIRRGGEHGPVVVAGDPGASRLYRRVARLEEPFMPMGSEALSANEIALLKIWIEKGAEWPKGVKEEDPAMQNVAKSALEKATDTAIKSSEAPADKFFQEKIPAIFSTRCQSCHNDSRRYSGLSLESREGLLEGGLHGPVVVPGDPTASRLYRRVARLERPYMPLSSGGGPGEPLPDSEVALLKLWIEQGAVWSRDEEAEKRRAAKLEALRKFEERPITPKERQWWAFQKPVRPPIPRVRESSLVQNPIDAFILAALKAKGLQPAPLASRQTLVRRVYLDLIGLPPRPEDVEAFLKDQSPKAYEKLIEHLLASERYGERWGRHWLDVARYADSDGYEYDKLRPQSWRYRDYVIRSFNQDKPYDRFIREQLAGDELPDRDYDSLVALGFCRNGPFIGDMVLMQDQQARMNELDDMVTATGAAFLGLTVGCARCHNHKFDPIAQKDYYRLVAVFSPSARIDLPLTPPAIAAKYESQVKEIDDRIEALRDQIRELQKPTRQRLLEVKYRELPEPLQVALRTDPAKRTEAQKRQAEQVFSTVTVTETDLLAALSEGDRKKTEALNAAIADLEKTKPPPLAVAHAITDPTPFPSKAYFLHRGNVLNRGSEIQPGTIAVLNPPGAEVDFPQPDPPAKTTGRRQALANWIASEQNPLTARVMVNRIWQHHFGKGLVATPNDFGRMGEQPKLPELLDWLATEFIRQGWSIKAMHRLILTSRTYQQSSTFVSSNNSKIDPENAFFWKMPLRRLEGEAIRDSILAVAGSLNLQAGGPGIFPEVDPALTESLPKGPTYQSWPQTKDGPEVWRRSVYVNQMRSIATPILDLFDPPENISSCPRRNTTTVAPQALQLLNNKFVARQAAIFAERINNEVGGDQSQQARRAFILALSRPSRSIEFERTLEFLKRQEEYHRRENKILMEQGVDPAQILPPAKAALVDLCHSFFNLNEFVYVN